MLQCTNTVRYFSVLMSCSAHLLYQHIQGTEIQLGLAVESQKASLSVKRRLACEQLTYLSQVSENSFRLILTLD